MSLKYWLTISCVFFAVIIGSKKDTLGGENKWTVLKKNVFKRSLDVLVVDPSNPNVLYASVGDTGVLKSVDGGKHWELKNEGLLNQNIQKIVIDPFRTNEIYACTNGGLYRSANSGEQWESVGFTPDTTVFAVAMVPRTPDIIYAAIDTNLYKSWNGGKSWHLVPDIPDTIHSAIRAIVVSMVNLDQLYIGTDEGIYKFQDDQDTIKLLRGPDEWKQKTTELVVAPHRTTQFIFAIFASGGVNIMGVYWAEEGKIRWRKINEGIQFREFPLLNLNLNPRKPKTLYAITKTSKILSYDLAVPEIGVLDFKVVGLPEWEIGGISRHIASRLNETHSVEWVSEAEVLKIAGPESDLTDNSTIYTIGHFFGFEMVISGEILVRQEQDSLLFNPKISWLTTKIDTSIKSVQWSKQGYYPDAIDEIVERVYQILDRRKSNFVRAVWQGYRKWLWLGPLGGFIAGYGICSLLCNEEPINPPPPNREKLPYPPVFP